jgi:hypothetical protein
MVHDISVQTKIPLNNYVQIIIHIESLSILLIYIRRRGFLIAFDYVTN